MVNQFEQFFAEFLEKLLLIVVLVIYFLFPPNILGLIFVSIRNPVYIGPDIAQIMYLLSLSFFLID